MGILADRIEKFILAKLLEEQAKEEGIVLRRNELADELNCAPSQISYVLSTRFSNDRGFIVESRRGLGGFISITRIPVKALLEAPKQQQTTESSDKPLTMGMIDNSLFELMQQKLLRKREAALLHEAFAILMEEPERKTREHKVRRLFEQVVAMVKEG
ncbi:CtsR family transcriptional regulator [Veillonella criceti]|uniref:Class three stress gene repressor n=1 Tax=Veillonella criceti TaxID=103891 RepID=A0A380NJT9_9FIRM|nr:CtsR family transcriptional regulator [Veillonella criceti]SUP41492.1 Class three stress gene repressor [Veillonella criceti]